MSTNKTTNYKLHSWVAGDKFLRAEMNSNFAKLDAELFGRAVMGSYTGDGTASRLISLGFTPRAVVLSKDTGETYRYPNTSGGLALADMPMAGEALEIVSGGFRVKFSGSSYTNHNGAVFYYLAVR